MLKKYSHLFEGLFMASDLVVASLCWVLSYWVRFYSGLLAIDKGIPPFSDYVKMLLFVWLIWAFVYRRFGLYRPMRGASRIRESLIVLKANSLSVILLLALTYLFREKSVEFSRLVFAIFFAISSIGALLSRNIVRSFLRSMRRRGHNLRYAMIVGAGELAANVAERINLHPEYGIELLGCLASDEDIANRGYRSLRVFANGRRYPVLGQARNSHSYLSQSVLSPRYAFNSSVAARAASASMYSTGYVGNNVANSIGSGLALAERSLEQLNENNPWAVPVIGSYSDLPFILGEGGIDQVIIALPLHDHAKIEEVVASVGDLMVDVKVVPDLHRFIQLGSQIEEFDGVPVVSLASTPLFGFNRVMKRGFDILLSAFFILLTLPLMIVIALLVKLTSRGPILFSQERVGLDGRVFHIHKFRTMYVNAEVTGARFAVKGDPRVTPLGKFLRRFSIDELPQLWNVLRGNMSLVGPRPERPVFINEFRKYVPRYMLRHKVQAGMTGWAQVKGWRGNTSIEKRIEHDLYYIENWSIALDVKILFLTIFAALFDRNAY